MKSKLSAALVVVVGGCLLAASPAIALSGAYNFPATMTSVPGAVLFDDFDSVQDTTIGTITGGIINQGTPPAAGNFLGIGELITATVTFANPVSYAGFAWGTADAFNEVDFFAVRIT